MASFRRLLPILLGTPLWLAACGQEQQERVVEVVRPVKTLIIPEPESSGIRSFPARIESTRRAEVSFRVPGKIVELPIVEGETVKKGQVIAKLDPTDYQLVVDDREAELFRARRDYERATELAKNDFITRKELDRREASLKQATAALELAKRDVYYTTLAAPFTGQISKRLVQNFEEIQAKQAIVELRDIEALEVKFSVPEQIMLRVTESVEEEGKQPDISVAFDAAPGKSFDLTFREIATTADPATRTFEATYTMKAPKDLLVLPGMTASVTADLRKYFDSAQTAYVPLDAVVSSNDSSGQVWIVDEKSMTVKPKLVSVGAQEGNIIAVTKGLKPRDRIVIAGLPYLTEGMRVRLIPQVEQAVERADDTEVRRAAEKALFQSNADEKKKD